MPSLYWPLLERDGLFAPGRAMSFEEAGRRKFAKLVAHHILGDENRNKFLAVMDRKRVPDHLRNDGRAPGPGLQDLFLGSPIHLFNAAQQPRLDIGALANGTRHVILLQLVLLATGNDELSRALCPPGLIALRLLSPRRNRMGIALPGLALSAPVGMIHGVHRDAADMRPPALPSGPSCFANGDIFMIGVSDLSDSGLAGPKNATHLAGLQSDLYVRPFSAHYLRRTTSAPD